MGLSQQHVLLCRNDERVKKRFINQQLRHSLLQISRCDRRTGSKDQLFKQIIRTQLRPIWPLAEGKLDSHTNRPITLRKEGKRSFTNFFRVWSDLVCSRRNAKTKSPHKARVMIKILQKKRKGSFTTLFSNFNSGTIHVLIKNKAACFHEAIQFISGVSHSQYS